jgi:hypothetical protein
MTGSRRKNASQLAPVLFSRTLHKTERRCLHNKQRRFLRKTERRLTPRRAGRLASRKSPPNRLPFSGKSAKLMGYFFALLFFLPMPKHHRRDGGAFPARQPDRPAAETPAGLAASLAKIRTEALARVTAQLDGRSPALSPPCRAAVFGDVRRSIGKAVIERAQTLGFHPALPGQPG